METLRILIADNHPIARTGLKLVLETIVDFKIVGEATSGQQTVELCEKLRPDIVLMDINMPNGNGVEATEQIRQLLPQVVVIAISAYKHEEMQREIIQAGAAGYISKEVDFAEMIELIRKIVNGRRATSSSDHNQFNLTHMELKMLNLLAEGYDRQQIADQLFISINTVKMHFRHLYQKLDVANAQDAIKVAVHHQLIS